jgi:hypothetical protein
LTRTAVGQIDLVSKLRRAINLILALALVAIGGGHFYFLLPYGRAERLDGSRGGHSRRRRALLAVGRAHQRGPETGEVKQCPEVPRASRAPRSRSL